MNTGDHFTGFISDEEIIRMFLARDERALQAVDSRYRPELLSAAKNILRSPEDAEECLQDTYLKTWNSIPPNHPDHLLYYMLKILKNQAVSSLRKQQAEKRIPRELIQTTDGLEEVLASGNTVEQAAEYDEVRWILNEYLEQAPDDVRYLFLAVFVFDRPVTEAAQEMGLSRYRAKKKLMQIRTELEQLLRERGYEL